MLSKKSTLNTDSILTEKELANEFQNFYKVLGDISTLSTFDFFKYKVI